MIDHAVKRFLNSIVGVAVFAAMPAYAQDGGTPPGAATGNPLDAAEKDVQASSTDIVVTAQRRSERARDVPISLTVKTAEELGNAGVTTIRDLHIVTPGLRIDRNGASVQPAIRGISTTDGNPGNDANVAIYLDGVYRPNPAANALDLPDVDRVEVLKGPQGTLFGRNATGGAIRIITRRPSFRTEGDVTLGYGSFDSFVAKGFVAGPLIPDVVAASLSAYYETNDGYLRDATRGGKQTGGLGSRLVRAKLLIKPTSSLEILLAGHYQKRSDGSLAGQPFEGNTATRGTAGVIIPTRPWDISANGVPHQEVEEYAFSGTVDMDLGFATLSSISAYSHVDTFSELESDYTNIDRSLFLTTQLQRTFSQELNLSSNKIGPLKWVIGGFYYSDRAFYDPLAVVVPTSVFNIYGQQKSQAYAAFGEVTYDISDRLTAIFGLRYSRERRILSGRFGARGYPELARTTFPSITPRAVLKYRLDDKTNIYASYSKGFKSGGYTASGLVPTPFSPEKVDAYEIGMKAAPSGSFAVNASGFIYDYTNQQVQAALTLPSGATVGRTINAASSRIYGAEFDATVQATPELSVKAAVSLLHARYQSFPTAFVQVPRTIAGVACLCGNVPVVIDASGNQLIRAPDATVSVSANYEKSTSAGLFGASATMYYSDQFFFTPDNRVRQPAYSTLGGRISFEPKGFPVRFTLWGRNLTNTVVYQGASILPDADGVLFAPSRSVGIEGRFRF